MERSNQGIRTNSILGKSDKVDRLLDLHKRELEGQFTQCISDIIDDLVVGTWYEIISSSSSTIMSINKEKAAYLARMFSKHNLVYREEVLHKRG